MNPITYTEGHFSGNNCLECRYFRYKIGPIYITWCAFGEKRNLTICSTGLCNEFIKK